MKTQRKREPEDASQAGTLTAKPRTGKSATQAKQRLFVIEQLNRKTGEKQYFAYDEHYTLIETERRLDRITKRVQKLLDRYEWDFTLQKVDANWSPRNTEVPERTELNGSTAAGHAEQNPAATRAVKFQTLMEPSPASIVEFSVDDWINMPAHPLHGSQQDVSLIPSSAVQNSVATVQHDLRHVTAAVTNDNEIYKVDGHARAALWERGLLARPASVVATLFTVPDEATLIRLYQILTAPGKTLAIQNRVAQALASSTVHLPVGKS